MKKSQTGQKLVAQNKKARHDYFIDDEMEAGLVLKGTEVKSLREGRINLKDSYARIKGGEVWAYNVHISEYPHATLENHEPERPRKLLLHKQEIKRLIGKVQNKGYSLIPLAVYFSRGNAKLKLALARGKRKHDKREAIKARDLKRDMERER